jgi:L-lactate dehydrogenase complex protein LldF
MQHAQSLPYASSLCGACYEVCPVKINIPEVLIHLRGKVGRQKQSRLTVDAENIAMKIMARIFASTSRFESAQRLARLGQWPFVSNGIIAKLPGMLGKWTEFRDLQAVPRQSFREWWAARGNGEESK